MGNVTEVITGAQKEGLLEACEGVLNAAPQEEVGGEAYNALVSLRDNVKNTIEVDNLSLTEDEAKALFALKMVILQIKLGEI